MENRSSLTIFTMILSVLACFAFLPQMQAQEGDLGGGNTNEGFNALNSLTSGEFNTGLGWFSLGFLTDGSFNTAVGAGALDLNNGTSNTAAGTGAMLLNIIANRNTAVGTDALLFNDFTSTSPATAEDNTAVGYWALMNNHDGGLNTAVGSNALFSNDISGNGLANFNTAVGSGALISNVDGDSNTAVGSQALFSNDSSLNTAVGFQALFTNFSGLENTAIGDQALLDNTDGNFNVAVGGAALLANMAGNDNTACGSGALNDTTGNDNTALGFQAGILATTGDGNVYVGSGMSGVAGETNHTYVRNINVTTVSGGSSDFVTVDLTTGLLGHLSSSRRYKEEIKPMNDASETLFALKPVTFRYKKDIDKSQSLDYGLIAEDVAQVDPTLAIRDRNGQIESVRYSAINAMLLNEFLKEHKKSEEQRATIAELQSTVAQQRKDFEATTVQQQRRMEVLTAQIKEQAAQIQKVSAHLEVSKPAPQVVANKP